MNTCLSRPDKIIDSTRTNKNARAMFGVRCVVIFCFANALRVKDRKFKRFATSEIGGFSSTPQRISYSTYALLRPSYGRGGSGPTSRGAVDKWSKLIQCEFQQDGIRRERIISIGYVDTIDWESARPWPVLGHVQFQDRERPSETSYPSSRYDGLGWGVGTLPAHSIWGSDFSVVDSWIIVPTWD